MPKRALTGGLRLSAAAVAALFLGACSSGQPAAPGSRAAAAASAAPAASQPPAAVVQGWGSFFDDHFQNAGTRTRPLTIRLPGTVKQVGSSNSTEYALLTDGQLYAWGLGGQGELGNGLLTDSLTTPVRVRFPAGVKIAWIPTDVMPYDTALAVDTAGRAWGWGANAIGELCLGSTQIQSTPAKLPFTGVTAMSGAADHDLYDAGGVLYACGQNVAGDLGDGHAASTLRPVRVAGINGADVTELVTSFANSGALLSDGRYYDWGYNADGQVGDGDAPHDAYVPVRVHLPGKVAQVALGGSLWGNGETYVLLADGSLWDWGSNFARQLGNGSAAPQPRPARFTAPPGVRYKLLAAGSATGYAVSATGDVYAWGVSHVGQVGNGSVGDVLTPVVVATGATMISATANNVVVSIPGE